MGLNFLSSGPGEGGKPTAFQMTKNSKCHQTVREKTLWKVPEDLHNKGFMHMD